MLELFAIQDVGHDDPRIRFIMAWNDLSGPERKRITPERICEMIGITPGHLFGLFAESVYDTEDTASRVLNLLNQTKLVSKAIKFAGRREGFKDRELLFKSSGFLPTTAGTSINMSQTAIAGSRSSSNRLDELLEPMEQDTLDFTEVIRGKGTVAQQSPSSFVIDNDG